MLIFKSLFRMGRLFLSGKNIEHSCLELLRDDPKDAMANQTLARFYWESAKYGLAYEYSVYAIQIDKTNQEIYLIAAASAYELEKYDVARKNAIAAVQLPRQFPREDNVTETFTFKIFEKLPFLSGYLQEAKSDLVVSSAHYDELISWAEKLVKD